MERSRQPLVRDGFFLRFYAILFSFLFVNSSWLRLQQAQTALAYFDIFITTLGIIGMICFVYRVQILSRIFWRIFAIIMMTWDVFMQRVVWMETIDPAIQLQNIFLALAILPPFYLCLILYGWNFPWLPEYRAEDRK